MKHDIGSREPTVLVVEDTPLNMELTTDLLETAGCSVLQATTAEEGMELARAEQPHLILFDIALPGMDGITATRLLKQDPQTKEITIILLTAHAMKGTAEEAQTSGCDGYITKPIDTREFMKMITEYFGNRKAA